MGKNFSRKSAGAGKSRSRSEPGQNELQKNIFQIKTITICFLSLGISLVKKITQSLSKSLQIKQLVHGILSKNWLY